MHHASALTAGAARCGGVFIICANKLLSDMLEA